MNFQFMMDENRHDTYRQFRQLSLCSNSLVLSDSVGNMKRLMAKNLATVRTKPLSIPSAVSLSKRAEYSPNFPFELTGSLTCWEYNMVLAG
ncbi:hypothetical protein OROGR_016306 [Orobanche gracilis]